MKNVVYGSMYILVFNHTDKEVNNYKLCKIDVVCTEPYIYTNKTHVIIKFCGRKIMEVYTTV